MTQRNVTFEARAVLKNYRSTAQKSRRVINLVRNKNVDEARAILKFAPQEVATPILKLLNSAVANILTKADRLGLRVTEDRLFISEIFADEGATMKRFRPRARGTAGRILKRTSHITLVVATDEEVLSAPKKSATKAKAEKVADVDADLKDKEADALEAKADKNEGPVKTDKSKAPGKSTKPAGPKDIKAHGTNKTAKPVVAKQKKGA
jgi:large subunit ribosomal protein L22